MIKLSKSLESLRHCDLETIEEAHSEQQQSSEIEKAYYDPRPHHPEELSLFSSLMEPSNEVDSGYEKKDDKHKSTKISMIIDWISTSDE